MRKQIKVIGSSWASVVPTDECSCDACRLILFNARSCIFFFVFLSRGNRISIFSLFKITFPRNCFLLFELFSSARKELRYSNPLISLGNNKSDLIRRRTLFSVVCLTSWKNRRWLKMCCVALLNG